MKRRLSGWRVALGFAVTLILLFLLLPTLITIAISFGKGNQIVFPPQGLSLHLYRRFFTEEGWVSSAWLSLRIATLSTSLVLLLGVPAAHAIVRGNFPGRRLLALFLVSPMMVPQVSIALALFTYFTAIRLNQGELRLLAAHCIVTLPYVIMTVSAGLQHVDPALERAATIMGASRVTVLRRVTLPLLIPSIVTGGLFAFLISFDEVVISWFVAVPEYTTLPVKMFSSIRFDVSPELTAISTMLTALSVVICISMAILAKEPRSA